MWPWFGGWHPWGWHWGGFPYGYSHPPSYGYPWAIPKEEEIRVLEDQERCLTTELEGVRKRLSELRGE
jgi:predicted NAD/FAD-binding protein